MQVGAAPHGTLQCGCEFELACVIRGAAAAAAVQGNSEYHNPWPGSSHNHNTHLCKWV